MHISWTRTLGSWLFALAIAGGALAAGTVHTITLCILTGVLATSALLVSWTAEPVRPRRAATLLLVTCCALTAYTAIQCVPLPIAWLARIAPQNADVWSRSLSPLHEVGPSWAPISVDPTATRIEVLKGIGYLLAFFTATALARSRAGVGFLSRIVVVTGLTLAIAALLHPAFGAHRLYGIWEPRAHSELYLRHLAPLLNPNNLAGYINIALCLAMAAALAPEPYWPRPLLAAAAIVLAGTQAWVASRGGVATMMVGAALVVALARGVGLRTLRKRAGVSLVAALVTAAGVVIVVLVGSERATSELFEHDLSKIQLVAQALGMLRAYGLWGTGRGAFESAFPAFRHLGGLHSWYVTFTHPENVLAQWLVEWGVPVGGAALVAVGIALRPSAVLARSTTAAGAWAGLVAFGLQNLADLGTEVPGLMLAPLVCAAIVVGGTAGQKSDWAVERWARTPRTIAVAGALATVCALLAVARGLGRELDDDRIRLRSAALEERLATGELDVLARETMLRHPAEPYLPFVVAVGRVFYERHGRSPLAWIEATLERASVYGPAHLVLAHWLAPRRPPQARLEYRLAVDEANELVWSATGEGAPLVTNYDDAMELVSAAVAVQHLELLRDALDARLPSTAQRLDEEIVRRAADDPGPMVRSARAAVDDLGAGPSAPWCDGPTRRGECERTALRQADRVEYLQPSACEPHLLRARARVQAGNGDQGLSELVAAMALIAERKPCLQALFEMAQDAGNERIAAHALENLTNIGCADDVDCAATLAWVAQAEEHRGNTGRALALYTRAYERAPDGPTADGPLQNMARLAAATGLHVVSAEDYDRLARRHPTDDQWRKAASEQRDQSIGKAALQ